MDNGKPIRETRDADIPAAVRHMYHHAGWAQVMETEVRRRRPGGCRAKRQQHTAHVYN